MKKEQLNKFLSYIHMGNQVYRIYYDQAKKLNDEKLAKIIVSIEETFKQHEEKMTAEIKKLNLKPTKKLTISAKFAIAMEKTKKLNSTFLICKEMLKSTNMGMLSAISFLHGNLELPNSIKTIIKNIIDDYFQIIKDLKNYILMIN